MKYGARNSWLGEVVEIKKGALMCQVTLRIAPGVHACSVMTLDSLHELGIKKGSQVRAVVKAVNVLLASEPEDSLTKPRARAGQ